MNKKYIKKVLFLWSEAYENDNVCVTISDLPPTTDEHDRWLSDGYKIAFDCVLSRSEFINLFGLSQSDVDRLLNDEVYMVSFDNLGSIFEPPIAVSKFESPTAVSDTVYIDGTLIKSDPSAKIYYDKDEHKNRITIEDEYNDLKSYI